jgi:hypothetical protein
MRHPLSPRIHGYIDYAAVVVLALAPSLFGFSGLPATLCWGFAIALLGVSLLTAYPLGVAKVIPFPIHGGIEAVSAPLLVIAPFLLGFSRDLAARNFFMVAGIALGIVYLVTNYRAAELPGTGVGVRRRTTV